LIYAPFPLTDIHWREDLVVNMRQETITQGEHETLVKNGKFTQIHDIDMMVNTSCPQLSAEVGLQRTFGSNELYIRAVLQHPLLFLELEVLLPANAGKAPLL
jgi:hypothetical protein